MKRVHPAGVRLREELRPGDEEAVRGIIESTRFFSPAEVDVAVELVQERRAKGPPSGYLFLFAEQESPGSRVVGYTCFGEIACTVGSYDLYWIAVRGEERGRGLGRWLLGETERRIAALGGRRVYIETSGREQYAPTQEFYLSCGYRLEARLEEFYGPGDAKLVYVKALA